MDNIERYKTIFIAKDSHGRNQLIARKHFFFDLRKIFFVSFWHYLLIFICSYNRWMRKQHFSFSNGKHWFTNLRNLYMDRNMFSISVTQNFMIFFLFLKNSCRCYIDRNNSESLGLETAHASSKTVSHEYLEKLKLTGH